MDAKCPECEQVAKTDDDLTKVICQHCNFESTYDEYIEICLLYTSPSPRDGLLSRMPSSA